MSDPLLGPSNEQVIVAFDIARNEYDICSKPCHGLNLVSTEEEDYLYNPCTGYYYKIPSDPESFARTPWEERPGDGYAGRQNSAFSIGLGFNPLNQEHIAIFIFYQRMDFGSRGYRLTCSVWQRCSWYLHSISNPPLPVNDMPPAYVDGVFYWMSDPLLGPSNEQVIVAFDIARNEYDICSKPCHGLNLVSTEEEDYLYNPCTGYYYKIPSDPESFARTPWEERPGDGYAGRQNSAFSIGLGFNPLNQEHIAIFIFYQRKDFGSRGYRLTCSVWQRCSWYLYSISNPPLPVNDMPPAYVDGVFYWMSDPLLGPCNEQVIVAFDIARNEYDTIPCPPHIARWCDNSHRHSFVTELEGMLCVVLADSMEDELQIWKQEHDEWERAYTICLKAWPDYSLVSNVVVPLSIDSKDDGRVMLSTGRKVGLYDPIGKTVESVRSRRGASASLHG
ncbi:hypothetical protein D1007_26275 [Hordeum vulgare]|nr:hypothetical protein D1007_26275 [Hordeum vulgare]